MSPSPPLLARVRLWRFLRWYQRLRRDPLVDDDEYFDVQFPRRFALRVAWHWSSDIQAYLLRPTQDAGEGPITDDNGDERERGASDYPGQ